MKIKKVIEKPQGNDSYMIRIYDQDLCSDWKWNNGIGTPDKHIGRKELIKDLKTNGLNIIGFTFSSFGACYFFEVEGNYNGNIDYQKLVIKPNDFCWDV